MKINKVIALTKIFLKNSFFPKNLDQTTKKENLKPKLGMKLLYFFIMLYVAGIIGVFSYEMIQGLIGINQETVFLGLLFLGIAGFLLIQSIFSIINVFYFSRDIEYVLPWPLSAREIVAAKLNVIFITEYFMEMLIGLVPLILYGILTGAGGIYYLTAAILFLVFPILPIVIVTLFILIIMSFAKLTKKRDSFQLFATIISIILVVGIQFGFNNPSQQEMTQETMLEQLSRANTAVEQIEPYFITLKPTINALSETNILTIVGELAKVIGITFISYVFVIIIGEKLYLKGAVGNLVGGKTKNKQINKKTAYQKQNIRKSYIKKEFKTLVRNPIFFMQCVLPSFLMPILMIAIIFFGAGNNNGEITMLLQEISLVETTTTLCILLGAMQFFSMFIFVSATAMSRDGLNATFVKYIPLSLYDQFKYKMLPNVIMHIITILLLEGFFIYLFQSISILFMIGVFIIAVLFSCINSYLMLIVDLKRPKLEWSTEFAVVKQNINLIFPTGFGLIGILFFVIIGGVLGTQNVILTMLILIALFAGILWLLDRYVRRNQAKLFEKII